MIVEASATDDHMLSMAIALKTGRTAFEGVKWTTWDKAGERLLGRQRPAIRPAGVDRRPGRDASSVSRSFKL